MIPNFNCEAYVDNHLQNDVKNVGCITEVIEICQVPKSVESQTQQSKEDDTIITASDRHFLADPTTIVLPSVGQNCLSDLWSEDMQQAHASVVVPDDHVIIMVVASNWRQVIVVKRGVLIRNVMIKLIGAVDGIKSIHYKGLPVNCDFGCNKNMTIDVQLFSKFIFVRFSMKSHILAIKVKPYHKGNDCKAQLATQMGLPMNVIRLFNGFHQVHDDTALWNIRDMISARIFPLVGGCSQSLAVETDVEVWMKSPIDGKLIVSRVASNESLEDVHRVAFPGVPIGHFFCDGHPIDAKACCESVSNRIVVSRYFPLRGGAKGEGKAKQTNAIKAIDFVTTQLEQRGVPKNECAERGKKVVSTLGVDFIIKIIDAEDSWAQMKSEASKHMIRLILPAEFKAWQQLKRAGQKIDKVQTKKSFSPALHPRDLLLKASDFKADGKQMKLINEDAIKPDCSGVCLMAPSSARNFLPVKRLSPDGLAIVTLGILSHSDPQIQCIASNVEGEDFVIRGNLYQFGDAQVVHCPACPTAVVQEVASSVVEVIIGRDFPWWNIASADIITAIAKLGIKANVRDIILGQWKFKAYDANRSVVSPDKAAHIHGYIRVKDGGLNDLLTASGQQSCFFNTRVNGGGKDDRFSFVPLPELSLEEAKCKAQTLQCSLGIVKGKGHYTLRCRREHYRKILKQLNPDMVIGDSSDDESDLTLRFRLEGVNFQTTSQELSSALKSLSWRAKAIRAMGATAWLIMAETPPPTRSFSLNNQLVVVKEMIVKTPLHQFIVSKPITAAPEAEVQGPVSTRLGQLESEMDQKIQRIIDKQMHEANSKIDKLETSMKAQEDGQKVLRAQFDQQRNELVSVSSKITNVATELQATQSSMLQSFEALIKAEMNNLHQRLASERESSEEKRRRKE